MTWNKDKVILIKEEREYKSSTKKKKLEEILKYDRKIEHYVKINIKYLNKTKENWW